MSKLTKGLAVIAAAAAISGMGVATPANAAPAKVMPAATVATTTSIADIIPIVPIPRCRVFRVGNITIPICGIYI